MLDVILTYVIAAACFVSGAGIAWNAWTRWPIIRGWAPLIVSFLLAMLSFWMMVSAWLVLFGPETGDHFGIPAQPAVISLFWGIFLILLYRKIMSLVIRVQPG